MKISSSNFHPMRGHVEAMNIVAFPDGSELVIRHHNMGWDLYDPKVVEVFGPFAGAYDLTAEVAKMDGERR